MSKLRAVIIIAAFQIMLLFASSAASAFSAYFAGMQPPVNSALETSTLLPTHSTDSVISASSHTRYHSWEASIASQILAFQILQQSS